MRYQLSKQIQPCTETEDERFYVNKVVTGFNIHTSLRLFIYIAASSSQDENPAATTSQDDKVRNSPVVALVYALSYFGLYWIEFFGIISACPIQV